MNKTELTYKTIKIVVSIVFILGLNGCSLFHDRTQSIIQPALKDDGTLTFKDSNGNIPSFEFCERRGKYEHKNNLKYRRKNISECPSSSEDSTILKNHHIVFSVLETQQPHGSVKCCIEIDFPGLGTVKSCAISERDTCLLGTRE